MSGCGLMSNEGENNISLKDIQNYINSGSQKEYSWYQRVTLTIPTEEGTASGSSVMKITWSENSPRINNAPWVPQITGEMPFVRLPDGKYVFALMGNGIDNLPSRFLIDGLDVNQWVSESHLKKISQLKTKKSICGNNSLMPLLVEFSDVKLPHSISEYSNNNICINIEQVGKRDINIGSIDNLMPWLSTLSTTKMKSSPTAFDIDNNNRKRTYVALRRDFLRE